MAKILYFGYGANRSSQKIFEILGKEPGGGNSAVLEGFNLYTQTLSQIPEKPRSILEKVWGGEFRSYTLKKGEGSVAGVLWELDEDELKKLQEWEFVGYWKEMIQVPIKTSSGETVYAVTEKVTDDQSVEGKVDGLFYENNINAEGSPDRELENYKINETREILREMERSGAPLA